MLVRVCPALARNVYIFLMSCETVCQKLHGEQKISSIFAKQVLPAFTVYATLTFACRVWPVWFSDTLKQQSQSETLGYKPEN